MAKYTSPISDLSEVLFYFEPRNPNPINLNFRKANPKLGNDISKPQTINDFVIKKL